MSDASEEKFAVRDASARVRTSKAAPETDLSLGFTGAGDNAAKAGNAGVVAVDHPSERPFVFKCDACVSARRGINNSVGKVPL